MNIVIYSIIYNSTVIYIGSTSNFEKRCSNHKSDYNRLDYPIYKYIREIGIDNITFEIVAFCNPENRDSYEGKFIRRYKDTIKNVVVNGRIKQQSDREYRIKNIDKIKEYDKNRNNNRKEYQKIYNSIKITCDCGKVINRNSLSTHKNSKIHQKNTIDLNK